MKWKWIFIPPLAILAMLLFTFIGGEIVLHLWNWLVPALFGWRQISFWQAIGLLVLCRILFGGSRWRGPGRYNFRRRVRMEERNACAIASASGHPPRRAKRNESFERPARSYGRSSPDRRSPPRRQG
jgi:hypothetical protein